MRKIISKNLRIFIPLALCCGLMAMDILSQQNIGRLSLGGWYYVIKQTLCWGLMLGALSFMLGKWSRWIYVPLFSYLSVIGIAETYVRAQFAVNFKGDALLVLLASSPSELYKYWMNNALAIVLSSAAVIVVTALVIAATMRARFPRVSVMSFCVGLLMLCPMICWNWIGHSTKKAFGAAIFHQVVSDTFENATMFADLGRIHDAPEELEDIRLSTSLDQAPTCVIVIGESATRNNFGIYGYERDTTPCLSSIRNELFVFTDLVGVWNNTPPAVRFLFTGATADDKVHARMMVTQAAAKAGYPQTFISNQGRWGSMNNTITCIFDTADKCLFLEEMGLPSPHYDDAMLTYAFAELESNRTSGQVIYLHQSGSHYPFVGLYPPERDVFGRQKTLDHYDNTVHFTDHILGELIAKLKELNRPAMLFYVSDHGDTPRAKNWRYFEDMDLWELPMFVWFSKEYKEKFPDVVRLVQHSLSIPLQSDQILPGLLLMMQIQGWADSASDKCFLNSLFVPRQQRMIKNWSEPYEH